MGWMRHVACVERTEINAGFRWGNILVRERVEDLDILTYLITYLLIYLLTYSMEQSPSWEANWFSASQEIPQILWNPKVHYCNHKCLQPVHILSQLYPVHTPTSHFLKIHLNIILPSMPESSKWSLSLRFPKQNSVYASPLPHMCYMAHTFHSSWFYHRIILGEEYRLLSFSLCRFLYSLVTLSRLGPTILLNTLFSNTLSQISSLNVSDQDLDIDRIILEYMLKK
jgi:hypothetical protein